MFRDKIIFFLCICDPDSVDSWINKDIKRSRNHEFLPKQICTEIVILKFNRTTDAHRWCGFDGWIFIVQHNRDDIVSCISNIRIKLLLKQKLLFARNFPQLDTVAVHCNKVNSIHIMFPEAFIAYVWLFDGRLDAFIFGLFLCMCVCKRAPNTL